MGLASVCVVLCAAVLCAQAQVTMPTTGTGSGSSGGTTGTSGSGSGTNMPPMSFHAPNAIHHVGVSYNLLKGNPDGEYWSTGGEDPGVSLTRKIFTVSPGDMPPEVQTEHHDGCQYSHGFNMFYSQDSYQQKLFTNVKTSGAADDALKPYAFTLSSAFQAVVQQTSKHHYVYQDANTLCTLGHVRYSTSLAAADHYPVTREFAQAVCALPVTYDQTKYMQFLDDWGTHVVTEVTIGKSTTYRYVSRFRDLFNYVTFNVSDELSVGGPLDGYQSSYVIDVNSYKYRHEYKYILGIYEDQLTIGDYYTNDVIAKTLMTLDSAIDVKYWQYMSYYVSQGLCASNAATLVPGWRDNVLQALKAYPAYKQAAAVTTTPLAMPATWPLGAYSIPKPTSDCASGFNEGAVSVAQERSTDPLPTGLHLAGKLTNDNYNLTYCTKEDPSPTPYDIYWPRGDYCIQQYDDSCPYAFKQGRVMFSGPSASATYGIVPTGTYGTKTTELQFCCRNDTVYSHKIFLPADQSFYLFRNQHHCQQVNGMSVMEETLTFHNTIDTSSGRGQTHLYGSYPYVEAVSQTTYGARQYKLHYCYYQPISK